MEEYNKIQENLNLATLEADIELAKDKGISLVVIKFFYEVDLNNTFFFKELIREMYKMLLAHSIFYDENNNFIATLKDKKLHESVALFSEVQNKIFAHYEIKLDRVGITILSQKDTLQDILSRVDRYLVTSKRLQIAKIIYGTREFDFFDEKSRSDSLNLLLKKNPNVTISNLYNGIPIEAKGMVLVAKDDEICIKTTNDELLYLKYYEKFLFLKHRDFPSIIKGDLHKFNFKESFVCINNIEFQDVSPIDRKSIRMKPSKKLFATIEYQDRVVANGEIVSLSTDSVAFTTGATGVKKIKILQKTELTIKFRLFSKSKMVIENMSIKTKVYKIIGDEIIFIIYPNDFAKEEIASYINTEKRELLQILKSKIMLNKGQK